jgi:glycosyltransferase involved in cell wall biosynthesis
MTKIAIIVMRYGEDIVGGAEYHARMIAEHLTKTCDVDILTTCAKDYHTWTNEYQETTEKINRVRVFRFKNEKIRDANKVVALENCIFHMQHTKDDEIAWINENGPNCPLLVHYIKDHYNEYLMFIFFTFRYYTSYFGIQAAKGKAFVVPEAENDPALKLITTQELFQNVKGIFYNVQEERDLILNQVRYNESEKVWDLIGCGISVPEMKGDERFHNLNPYIVYLGRIEGSKGCYQLFNYYQRLIEENPSVPDLILAGYDAIPVPKHKKIRYIGFVTESEKASLLSHAEFLVMPSPYESLSLVTLEALGWGIPVLVNGDCNVLKGHCIRSNAGLWYHNYEEFKECILYLLTNTQIRKKMSEAGKKYVKNQYSWTSVEKKYREIIDTIERENFKNINCN